MKSVYTLEELRAIWVKRLTAGLFRVMLTADKNEKMKGCKMSLDYILQTADQTDATAWMYCEPDADSELAEIAEIEAEEGLSL